MILNDIVDEREDWASAAGSVAAAAVTGLGLSDFRCHRRLRLDLGGAGAALAPVVLVGDNGSGKTSVLEAVSLLAPGRGLRRARLADLARRAADGRVAPAWSVAARLRTPTGAFDVTTGWAGDGEGGGDRRQLKVDGQPARSLAVLAEAYAVLWLTPEMDRVFAEGTGARRRFLDRLVLALDPAHAARLHAYERAMHERATLLRQGRADPGWLAALEENMASAGVAIVAARRETAQRLSRVADNRADPFPAATLAAAGVVETWLDEAPALAVEDRLRDALAAARRNDGETGTTAVGPHRSDLDVRHARTGRPAAASSTGEQKMLLIAIVLASADVQGSLKGTAPLLLLDEVAAHLDRRHRLALFDRVGRLGAQAWYTGTDREVFRALEGAARFVPLAPRTETAAVHRLPVSPRFDGLNENNKERETPDE